ncbi:MAG: carboxypeptidase regulatory-like domain-containing protein [candidate division Zixibacteria bacterium]|nr:carboxypeptidase regulatory-like domain-containing protein [candidate division Zixibacteria bacterium]
MKLALTFFQLLFFVGLSATYAENSAPESNYIISGVITDSDAQPIIGATVVLFRGDSIVGGTNADVDGRYRILFSSNMSRTLSLRCSAVGFAALSCPVSVDKNSSSLGELIKMNYALKTEVVEIGQINVYPDKNKQVSEQSFGSDLIAIRARHSLMPTNLTAAIKSPDVIRNGSMHSSQIRVNGTNPHYLLNGTSIGADPDHYGMFSLIPSTVVQNVNLSTTGSNISHNQPSTVAIESMAPFVSHRKTTLNLSTVEATGTASIGTQKAFVVGAARHSVLDELIRQLDIDSERRTIPPTNFKDVFLTAGLKLSPNSNLVLDQFFSKDYLRYNTGDAIIGAPATNTSQNSQDYYAGLRYRALVSTYLIRGSFAIRQSEKNYFAALDNQAVTSGVRLDLKDSQRRYLGNLEVVSDNNRYCFTVGNQFEYVSKRTMSLSQQNWNFLPPFANSDNPYIYQHALNHLYNTSDFVDTEFNNALYVSVKRYLGESFNAHIETGIRLEHFSALREKNAPVFRASVHLPVGENKSVEASFGTFAENPAGNILEPYQPIVRAFLSELSPSYSQQASIGFASSSLKIGFFHKAFSDLPVISPDFENGFNTDGSPNSSFLKMQSVGKATFYGGSVAYERDKFLSPKVSLYGSYAYSHAEKSDLYATISHEQNAPHRFMTELNYKLSRKFTVGSELQIRSGYSYTPVRYAYSDELANYNPDYFSALSQYENSSRFATHAFLNLSGEYEFGGGTLFMSVSNITNRANSMISSASGVVYDAGIVPMIGVKWRL